MPNWGNAGGGLLSSFDKTAITAQLRANLTDADGAVSVTVATPTSGPTVDDAAGTGTRNTDDDTVTALRGDVSLDEAAESAGLQVGDIRYQMMADDLSSVPTTASTVIDGSDRRQVVMVSTDPLGLMHTLTTRETP